MTSRLSVLAAAALIACGCRTPRAPERGYDVPEAADAGEASIEASAARLAETARRDYKLSPADVVNVTVYEVAEMNRKTRINGSGMIFLPLIGGVKVGGRTMGEAQKLIESKLADFVVRPQVSLLIEEYGNKNYFVMGEVQKPGSYPIPTESRITVLGAISTAGGFTPVAAQDRARLLRRVNGRSVKYTIDVQGITQAGQKEKDMIIEPNDVVFIPQSLF